MKYKKIFSVASVVSFMFLAESGFARKVNISIPGNTTKLQLSNPSSVTVNFDIKCFDMSGAQLINQTGLSLASKAGNSYAFGAADSGKCAGSTNPISTGTDIYSKNIYLCQGSSVNYANANSLCGTGNSLCFPTVSCGNIPGIYTASGAWILRNSNYKISNMSGLMPPSCGAAWTSLTTGYAPIYSCGNSYYSTVDNGANHLYQTNQVSETSTYNQSICCANPAVYASTCEVNITSTDKAATLASPEFKGGVPF